MLSCGLLFLIAELILFQPNDYDNNKLFYIAYMIAVIIVSEYLVSIYNKLVGINLRGFLCGIGYFRYAVRSYDNYPRISLRCNAVSDIAPLILKLLNILKTTPTCKRCVCYDKYNHINPVVSLRKNNICRFFVVCAFPRVREEYTKRSEELKTGAYEGSSQQLCHLR